MEIAESLNCCIFYTFCNTNYKRWNHNICENCPYPMLPLNLRSRRWAKKTELWMTCDYKKDKTIRSKMHQKRENIGLYFRKHAYFKNTTERAVYIQYIGAECIHCTTLRNSCVPTQAIEHFLQCTWSCRMYVVHGYWIHVVYRNYWFVTQC